MENVKFGKEKRRVLILYGSQTGQAKAISQALHEQLLLELNVDDNGLFLATYGLDLIDRKFCIERETTVIFVVSTTGEGEPPDNAVKCWRRLNKRTLPSNHLAGLSYTLLGLGDSNYNRFASFARDLDNRLQDLGAKKLYLTGFGDEAEGTEIGVERWLADLTPNLLGHLGLYQHVQIPKTSVPIVDMGDLPPSLVVSSELLRDKTELSLPLMTKKMKEITVAEVADVDPGPRELYFHKLPVMDSPILDARISSIRRLNSPLKTDQDAKVILEAKVDVSDSTPVEYVAGDSFGFICGNRDYEVNLLLQRLGLEHNAQRLYSIRCPGLTHLPEVSTLFNYIKYYTELRSVPMKACIRCFAEFCEDPGEKRRLLELSSREGSDDYAKFIRTPGVTVLDLLQTFTSCCPSLEAIFANVPCFVPRYYSVVHAQHVENRTGLTIAFSVVQLELMCQRGKTQLTGVFTGWLHDVFLKDSASLEDQLDKLSLTSCSHIAVKIFKRKNPYFKLPKSLSAPLILVGPGTGIVPFIGFMEERQKLRAAGIQSGPCLLFFGCRHPEQDFIYESTLKSFSDDGTITKLSVCFSRHAEEEEGSPKYVQDMLKINGKEVYDALLNDETMVYVCGDVKKMSTDVFNAFVNLLEEFENLIREPAVKKVRDLQSSKRYLQDLWL